MRGERVESPGQLMLTIGLSLHSRLPSLRLTGGRTTKGRAAEWREERGERREMKEGGEGAEVEV